MLNDQSQIIVQSTRRARDSAPAVRSLKRSREAYDYNVKSATRALEVIELFGVHRSPVGHGNRECSCDPAIKLVGVASCVEQRRICDSRS
jgi:hypothetical protein